MLTIQNIQYLNTNWATGGDLYYLNYKMKTDEEYILTASKSGSELMNIHISRNKNEVNLYLVAYSYNQNYVIGEYRKDQITKERIMDNVEKIIK